MYVLYNLTVCIHLSEIIQVNRKNRHGAHTLLMKINDLCHILVMLTSENNTLDNHCEESVLGYDGKKKYYPYTRN